jgi:hypothetical protein
MSTVTTSRSAELRAKVDLVIPHLGAAFRRLEDRPDVADLYPEYLVTMHWMIRSSVPLMEDAIAHARGLPGDAVATGLIDYCAAHIAEEEAHDDWLLEDLAVLGVDPATALARPPSATVAAMVGAQYYWIRHHHPAILLGYIFVMEGYPSSPQQVDSLEARTGHPTEAFRTLRIHAELDPGHGRDLDAMIDGLDLDDHLAGSLGTSAIHTVGCAAQALHELTVGR